MAAEKLAAMSIHDEIRTRRKAKGLSQGELANEVSKREGLARPLTWQTVQNWEKTTAPKRKRLEVVAAILGCTVMDLLGSSGAAPSGDEPAPGRGSALPRGLSECLFELADHLAALDPDARDGAKLYINKLMDSCSDRDSVGKQIALIDSIISTKRQVA